MNEPDEAIATLYVLDQLDDDDRTAFAVRLAREPALVALVRDLEDGLARGVRALPPTEPPADLLGKIESKIHSEARTARPATARHPVEKGWKPATTSRVPFLAVARWGIAAVIAVSLGILAVQSLRPAAATPTIIVVGLDANRSTFAELPLPGAVKDTDARFIQLATLARKYWDKPGELPVNPAPDSGDNRGYALFDPGSGQGFIAIEQLGAITDSQRYHLWVVDPATAKVRDAGVLPVSAANRGLYSFAVGGSAGPGSNRPQFFVTAEDASPATPSAQPRGQVVLGSRSF